MADIGLVLSVYCNGKSPMYLLFRIVPLGYIREHAGLCGAVHTCQYVYLHHMITLVPARNVLYLILYF